ncbi:type II secretion system protein [Lysobacter sp. GCM10012299]|uniref:type II secretion system protein n=1 Tax=Lysobacter sp. GCM10012299 TaxID=3317333 RepID=UPI0036064D12
MVRRATERQGFTLIELLVVLAIMGALLTLVVPRYFEQADRAKETVLRENLTVMRVSIDHFHADRGRYPQTLQELVEGRYLREVPTDTLTGSRTTWTLVAPADGEAGIYDVRSGARGKGKDGTDYSTW